MASAFKNFGIENNIDDFTLTLAGALGSAMNGTSRIVWATLSDKYGFKKIYACILIL